ncbi:MAG TPA: SDR family NAD(P)-dependent oxidoreductase [Ramlibacter sp.]|nr:SDR family NAD(P)-dependent oxidoreductase [Ramlibacter sp.]
MYTLDLSGRTAIVTGGARGIGGAITLHLAQAGANVVIANRDPATAERTAAKARELGAKVLAVACDVAVPGQIEHVVAQANATFGQVDIVVSNAGVGTRQLAGDTTDDEFARVMDTNVRALMALARATVPAMKERRAGRIIAISSSTGRSGKGFLSFSPTYAAAKAGMIGYVRSLARECGPYGITVNAVCPGWVDSGEAPKGSPEVRAAALQEIPLRRTGVSDDIAGMVTFLATGRASYITGACLDINGGLYMA